MTAGSDRRAEADLLESLRSRQAELTALFEECSSHWGFEDPVFLEMTTRYGTLQEPPTPLPSGYAALLCLYGLR